jgi:cytochrome c-type biogenesis protein CcmH
MRNRAVFLLALTLIFFGSAELVAAQGGGPTANEVNAIAKNLYCPVCESVPLDVCPTVACQQWRQQIADKLQEGYSEQEIYDFFVEQYGDRVLASPPARGLNWLIYVIPPVVIILGALIYIRTVTGSGSNRVGKENTKSAVQDIHLKQIEEELDARR